MKEINVSSTGTAPCCTSINGFNVLEELELYDVHKEPMSK